MTQQHRVCWPSRIFVSLLQTKTNRHLTRFIRLSVVFIDLSIGQRKSPLFRSTKISTRACWAVMFLSATKSPSPTRPGSRTNRPCWTGFRPTTTPSTPCHPVCPFLACQWVLFWSVGRQNVRHPFDNSRRLFWPTRKVFFKADLKSKFSS